MAFTVSDEKECVERDGIDSSPVKGQQRASLQNLNTTYYTLDYICTEMSRSWTPLIQRNRSSDSIRITQLAASEGTSCLLPGPPLDFLTSCS